MRWLGFPVVVIISVVLTIIPPIVCIVPGMESGCRALVCLSSYGAMVGEQYHALGLGEAK